MSMLLGTTTVCVGLSCSLAERGLRVVSVMDARDGRPSGSVAEPLHATERAAAGHT